MTYTADHLPTIERYLEKFYLPALPVSWSEHKALFGGIKLQGIMKNGAKIVVEVYGFPTMGIRFASQFITATGKRTLRNMHKLNPA